MPFAEVATVRNFLNGEEKSVLAKKLTKILIDTERLQDNPISRSIALIDIKEFDDLFVGGEKSLQNKIVVKIYAFSDALNSDLKAKLYKEITDAFIDISEETRLQNGRNVWCMIISLGESDFGVGGRPITLEFTKQFVSSYTKQ